MKQRDRVRDREGEIEREREGEREKDREGERENYKEERVSMMCLKKI